MKPSPHSRLLNQVLENLVPLISCGPKGNSRNRSLPAPLVVCLFALQALYGNLSCRGILAIFASATRLRKVPTDSAYCQARRRLRPEHFDSAERTLAKLGKGRCVRPACFEGYDLKAIDATDFTVMDTPENRDAWTYPTGQKPGCGFPVLSCLIVRNLETGVLFALNMAKWAAHDLRLFLEAAEHCFEKTILVADRAFDAFAFYATVKSHGGHVVCRFKEGKRKFLEKSARLSRNEWTITIKRPTKSSILDKKALSGLPTTEKLRLVHAKIKKRGFRDEDLWIATTLLDSKKFPAEQILWAYSQRWGIEVAFRDVKTSMNAEFLRVASPDMTYRAIRAFLFASNLVRMVFLRSRLEKADFRLSFKTALPVVAKLLLDVMNGANPARRLKALKWCLMSMLFERRTRKPEPRACKRRKQRYPLLTAPRHEYVEIQHIKHYKKMA